MSNNEVHPAVTSGHVMRLMEKFEPRSRFTTGRVANLAAKFEEYKRSTTAHISWNPKFKRSSIAGRTRAVHDSGDCTHFVGGGQRGNDGLVQTSVIDKELPQRPKRSMSVELVRFQSKMLVGTMNSAVDDNVSYMCLLPLNTSGFTDGSVRVPESDNIHTQPRPTSPQKDIRCSNIDVENSREIDASKSSSKVLTEKMEARPSVVHGNVRILIERFNAMYLECHDLRC